MRKTLLFLIFAFLSLSSLAQQRIVRGKVTNTEDGTDLPGVSVVVQGTTRGTVTDVSGQYQIQVNEGDKVLVFSFIWMLPREVPIGDQEIVDVTMSPDAQQLSEVVWYRAEKADDRIGRRRKGRRDQGPAGIDHRWCAAGSNGRGTGPSKLRDPGRRNVGACSRYYVHQRIGSAGTDIEKAIHQAYENGSVVGGTSAGAAVMSKVMITGSELKHPDYESTFRDIEAENIETRPGLGLIRNAIIDQHFVRRSRHNRLISAIIEFPDMKGIGIDESTAILVKGNDVEVVGDSQVIVLENPKRSKVIRNGKLGASGIVMTVLLPGDTFKLR